MKSFRSVDGTSWSVTVELPSHSSALVVFVHPAGIARLDRYATFNAHGPQVSDPRARLDQTAVLSSLNERDLGRLFRRSMPIQTTHQPYVVS
jgi:hypothetical protein